MLHNALPGVCGKYCGALNHSGQEAIAAPPTSLQLIAQGAGGQAKTCQTVED